MLLIKAQWPKQDHLLAGARTGSRRCVSTSFCSVSVQPALHCKPLVDFNASKCSNRDRTERVQHTLLFTKVRFEPSGEGDNCFRMKTNKTCSHDWSPCMDTIIFNLNTGFSLFLSSFKVVKIIKFQTVESIIYIVYQLVLAL